MAILQLNIIHLARLDQSTNTSRLFPLGLAGLLRRNLPVFREELGVVSR